jgi:hypothetical protein
MFAVLGAPSTAIIALFPDVSETRTHVGEHSSPVCERLTPLCERRADVISRFTDGVEDHSDFGESFTDFGQKLADRGSLFVSAGQNVNAVASAPFPVALGRKIAGFERSPRVRKTIASPRRRSTSLEIGAADDRVSHRLLTRAAISSTITERRALRDPCPDAPTSTPPLYKRAVRIRRRGCRSFAQNDRFHG